MNKKVLIITYYWPPSGGAGVQRWLKFVKYLPEYGWEPIIIVPEGANYPSLDSSLESDIAPELKVIRLPIWEPYNLYRKFLGLPKSHKISHTFSDGHSVSNWKQKLSIWFKCNFFIPDPRVFWLISALSKVEKIIIDHNIEYIVTTSPPNSVHLFGLFLKKRMNLKWLVDLRDPWTNIYFEKSLPYTKFSKAINGYLERKVLQSADWATTVSPSIQESLSKKYPNSDISFLPNGYDEANINNEAPIYSNKFILTYTGTLYNLYNMPVFWEAISELVSENLEFSKHISIEIAGSISQDILLSFQKLNIQSYINYLGYLPHAELNALYSKSHIFLLTTPSENNHGILTGKVFEYLARCKPILCITSKGNDLSKLIEKCQAGFVFDYNEKEKIKVQLTELFNSFQSKSIKLNDNKLIAKFSRRNLTNELSQILKSIELKSN